MHDGKNHSARNCRVGKSESTAGRSGTTTRNSTITRESRGQNSNTAKNSSNTRQVDAQETKDTKLTDTIIQKELSDLLVSESDDGDVFAVQAGNGSRCVKVEIQGVPVYGILDTGTDITIIGGKLFKLIATKATPRVKKDLQQPDKIPQNYDGNTFTLDGKMDLKVSFQENSMITLIYIKMDAKDQLLLSETVC